MKSAPLWMVPGRLLAGLGILVLTYILTAPPVMKFLTFDTPREWPWLYKPLVPCFWCPLTRPFFLWYFDDLWQADTEIRGE